MCPRPPNPLSSKVEFMASKKTLEFLVCRTAWIANRHGRKVYYQPGDPIRADDPLAKKGPFVSVEEWAELAEHPTYTTGGHVFPSKVEAATATPGEARDVAIPTPKVKAKSSK